MCAPGDRERIGEWRYALIAGPFEPTQRVTAEQLGAAWRGGAIAAAADTEAVLAPVLGVRASPVRIAPGERPVLDARRWAIVPADELAPSWSVIAVDDQHPLTADNGPLVVPLCGSPRPPIHNIRVEHLTTLVMSGTTALTGRTAERIDDHGIADTIRHIQPFFASADLVHVSNEVSFVDTCQPWTGQQQPFKFCARDRYVALLEALHTRLVELTGNHLLDYGPRALARTLDMYQQRGWIWFGGGRTQIDATAPRIVEDHGNRLAFVGCNAVNWWVHAISPGLGVASCDWPRMAWQIRDLRRRGYLPIATVQHRELRSHAPPPDLVHDLRGLAEAGAAFVQGSQAHVAHPWDVHHGAFVHYGPGNILFAQHRVEQRDATVDKLYIHEGRLLTVAHLFTRTEHGQPRPLDDAERAEFLDQLAAAEATLAPPEPWAAPGPDPGDRGRPDSLVIRGRSQPLTVIAPEHVAPGARYRLVVDLTGTTGPLADAFVVAPARPARKPVATGAEIARFMRSKYPIDAGAISIVPRPPHAHLAHHHAGAGLGTSARATRE
ncbi:MAG TPA: CapA family protein [Kofleriaceae bacterium]|nr:CapA family protein [Kofleriaceae bacterium]